jgi:hypothetical protein
MFWLHTDEHHTYNGTSHLVSKGSPPGLMQEDKRTLGDVWLMH